MLILKTSVLDQIRTEGAANYPNECCGLLIGRFEGERRVATLTWPVENAWTAEIALTEDETERSLRDRFYISPQDYLKAQRAAARRDLDLIGCYHSHPDDRAWPSERDRVGAAGVGGGPDFSFVIVSVIDGTPADVASALLSLDGQHWLPEELSIEEA